MACTVPCDYCEPGTAWLLEPLGQLFLVRVCEHIARSFQGTGDPALISRYAMKKLYVGNFSWNTTDQDLEEMFSAHGTVESCMVIKDRDSGRSRGFGFVEMDDAGASAAIEALDGAQHDGRQLRVNEAQERSRNGGGGGGGRGGSRW